MLLAIRWANLGVYSILTGLIWFVFYYFPTAQLWLALTITVIWTILIVINFLSPYSLVYQTIDGMEKVVLPWGEQFFRLVGERNIWSTFSDLNSVIILLYLADASIRLGKKGDKRKAILIGGSSIFFIIAAGIHTPLVDIGLINSPYLITFAFLFIVLAMGFEISYSVIRSAQISKEVRANERRWRSLLENVHLLVLQLDTFGQIKYINPHFAKISGYQTEEIINQNRFNLFIPQEQKERISEAFKQLLHQKKYPHYQNNIIMKYGEKRLITWSNVPLYDSEGNIEGSISIGADVTTEHNALREIERLKDRLQEENIYLREEIILDHNYRDRPVAYTEIKRWYDDCNLCE